MTAKSLNGQGTWLDVFEGEEGNNTNVQLTVPAGSAQAKRVYRNDYLDPYCRSN